MSYCRKRHVEYDECLKIIYKNKRVGEFVFECDCLLLGKWSGSFYSLFTKEDFKQQNKINR